MNLIFTYRECNAAMLAADWREIENWTDRSVYAKGDARATLHMNTLQCPVSKNTSLEVVVASEGIEFARSVTYRNEHGFPVVRAIPTQPGWVAHQPTKKEEQEKHHEF